MSKIILGIVIVLVLIGAGWWYWDNQNTAEPEMGPTGEAVLSDFTVNGSDRELVATGQNLARVEVWSRSDLADEGEILGEMNLRLEEEDLQTWTWPLPQSPIDTAEIYAIGYNADNVEVGEVSLPFQGREELYNALWLQIPFEEAALSLGETYTDGDFGLKLLDIAEDNRCPAGVECIQAGRVTADLEVTLDGQTEAISLSSDEGERQIGEYYVNLINVDPPAEEGVTLSAADYTLTFYITRELSKL